jgi:hypothetical protein
MSELKIGTEDAERCGNCGTAPTVDVDLEASRVRCRCGRSTPSFACTRDAVNYWNNWQRLTKATNTCSTCAYFKPQETRTSVTRYADWLADQIVKTTTPSVCRRYPAHVLREGGDWCGEWKKGG